MAISYGIILKECLLRSSQISGSDQAELETAYGAETIDGAEIPISSFRAQIINIEGELSHIIASDASHPYRSYIQGTSSALANLADTPTLDDASNPFIGVFDSVMDGSTSQPCTFQPTQTILDYQDPFFDDIELYNYSIVGNTIQHTRSTVKMQGCVFDRTERETAYDADGSSPLPPILANMWIAGVMANLQQVGWTDPTNTVGLYGQLYQQGITMLRQGSSGQVNLPLSAQANPIAG